MIANEMLLTFLVDSGLPRSRVGSSAMLLPNNSFESQVRLLAYRREWSFVIVRSRSPAQYEFAGFGR
jgi:hypothetical protein